MQIKSQKDFWSGVMFIAVGLGFAWGAQNYAFGDSARPGPGYFPFGLGILLAALGAAVVLLAMRRDTEDGDPIGSWAWRPLFIVVGAAALFAFMLPRTGLLIALPVLVFVVSLAGDEFHPVEAAINAVVLTAASWLIFIKGLSLTLPVLPAALGG